MDNAILRDLRFIPYEDMIRKEIDIETAKTLLRPKHDDDFKKDIRYKLGIIEGMQKILKLNEEWRKV